jgi:SAM-dependent methyltransferase
LASDLWAGEVTGFHVKKTCGFCGSTELREYLNLGSMPLVDAYRAVGEAPAEKYPLAISYCENCSNSQISCIVDPKTLFDNYPYQSSVSETLRLHFAALAEYVSGLYPERHLRCIDIASNDGCLPLEFSKHGWDVVGIEPAQNLAAIAARRGVSTINLFWGEDAACAAISKLGAKADVVTATNVFPHVENSHEFLRAVSTVLADDGVLIIEGSYVKEMIERGRFDLIFHEHVYQLLVKPLVQLLAVYGMEIYDLSVFHLHCGSLRVVVGKSGNKRLVRRNDVVKAFHDLEEASGLYRFDTYLGLAEKMQKRIRDFTSLMEALRAHGDVVIGYGAASKANVLVNSCGLTREHLSCIIDDTLDKQERLFPGTDIPVASYNSAIVKRAHYIWISAWDFTDEIIKKVNRLGDFCGKYIVTIEEPEIR